LGYCSKETPFMKLFLQSLFLLGFTMIFLSGCMVAPVRRNVFPEREKVKKMPENVNLPPQVETNNSNQPPTIRRDTAVIVHSPDGNYNEASQPAQYRERNNQRRQEAMQPTATSSMEPDRFMDDMPNIGDEFARAMRQFDAGQIQTACQEFDFIAGTLPMGDSLYYEARFMQAECRLTDMKLTSAVQILYALGTDAQTPPAVREKTLLRLGHAYCLVDDTDAASQTFARFMEEFPNSQYKAIANCRAVK
jgi:TolA-binding protein